MLLQSVMEEYRLEVWRLLTLLCKFVSFLNEFHRVYCLTKMREKKSKMKMEKYQWIEIILEKNRHFN